MQENTISKNAKLLILVASLGYFVDVYDLILFGVIRNASLASLGLDKDGQLSEGLRLLNIQMAGMLLGGLLWGILGDKRGRKSVLFGSILLYSLANALNGMVTDLTVYAILRFLAGVGLAGELGAGVTLVNESLPKEKRGYGALFIAGTGACLRDQFVIDLTKKQNGSRTFILYQIFQVRLFICTQRFFNHFV